MALLRTTLGLLATFAAFLLPLNSAIARPGGGFSGGHGGGFSGGHSGGFSSSHGQMSGGHWGGHGGWYRGGYGRGYYGGYYGGVYFDPWAFDAPWGYGMSYPAWPYADNSYDVTPPVDGAYIQQGAVAPNDAQTSGQTNDWFYCSNPAGYYPYVRSCSVTWQRVPATPSD